MSSSNTPSANTPSANTPPSNTPAIVNAAEWNVAQNYKRFDSPTTIRYPANMPMSKQQLGIILGMAAQYPGTVIFNGAEMNQIRGDMERTRSETNVEFVPAEADANAQSQGTSNQTQGGQGAGGKQGGYESNDAAAQGLSQGGSMLSRAANQGSYRSSQTKYDAPEGIQPSKTY